MIVVDTSAIIAILEWEKEADQFLSTLVKAPDVAISTVTMLECYSVAFRRHKQDGLDRLQGVLQEVNLRIRTFTEDNLSLAKQALVKYGKGVHKAGLNFGDCASYALAKSLDAPLLFKGDDFSETDVKRC